MFGAYLNQDYELSGATLEEVIQSYKDDSGPEELNQLLSEIDRFRAAHVDGLDEAFLGLYGFDFDPRLWGHDTSSFLSLLAALAGR